MTTRTTSTTRWVEGRLDTPPSASPALLPRCVWCGERTAPGRLLCPDCQAIPPRVR